MLNWIRRRPRLFVLLLTPILGCLIAEGGLRWLLFGESDLARTLGKSWREPGKFTDASSADYWVLSQRWLHHPGPLPPELFDSELGWLTTEFEREGWHHPNEEQLGDRRPVLLFGDSFARGLVEPNERFQALLDASPLGATHGLINYGVGAFGCDQVLLLMRDVLPRWRERKPFVLVALCLDDSVDRALLDFRGWPKPRFRDDTGELTLEADRLPTVPEYLEAHPPSIASYAWTALLRSDCVPEAWRPVGNEQDKRWRASARRMTSRVLGAMHAELENAHVEHAFLLFEGARSLLRRGPPPWRVECAEDTLAALGEHYVRESPLLLEDALLGHRSRAEYYAHSGQARDHLSAVGHRAAFAGFVAALHGELPPPGRRVPVDVRDFRITEPFLAVVPTAAWSFGTRDGDESAGRERLLLRPEVAFRAHVEYDLDGRAKRFVAKLRVGATGGSTCPAPSHLSVAVDRKPTLELDLDGAGRELDVDLSGARTLELSASACDAPTEEARLELVDPRFE